MNHPEALRWLLCAVISLCLPEAFWGVGLLFSAVFVLIGTPRSRRLFMTLRILAILAILSIQLRPAPFVSGSRFSGTVVSVSAGSFVLQSEQGRFQVISKALPDLDDQVQVEGISQAFDENDSFYGFDAKAWSLRERLNGRIYADTLEIGRQGKTPRAFLQRRIAAISDPLQRALANKFILGVNERETGLAILLRCGFQYSVILGGFATICGWFWKPRTVRWMRLGTALGIAVILHFPYPLIRLSLNEGFRFLSSVDRIEKFEMKWTLLLLLAPRRVATAAFLLPFAFALCALFPFRQSPRISRFNLSWCLQSGLFHSVSPVMVLGMQPLRWGLGLCTLGCLGGLIWPPGFTFSTVLAGFLDRLVQLGGVLPGKLSWIVVVLASLTGLLIKRHRAIVFSVLLILWTVFGWWHPWASLTLIDVGQGDSLLLRLPYNQGNILIDTGKPAAWDQVEAMLEGEGIRRLDALILTHQDEDHSGNKEVLIERYHPSSVVEELNEPLTIGGLTLFNLNADPDSDESNENSLVLLLRMNDLTMLLSGDAPVEVEQKILNQIPGLRADVIKLGHHGSQTSSCLRWLKTLQPKLALNSSGRGNRYGHPHPDVVRRLLDCRIPLLDTQQEGDIRIVMTPICNFLFTARRGFAIIGEVIR